MLPDGIASLVDALPLPALLIGLDGRIRCANARAGQVLGVMPVGRHYVAALRQPGIMDAVEGCLRDGGERQARFLGQEGRQETTWHVAVTPVAAGPGQGVLVTLTDLTQLEAATAMRRDFVANVSHELRTPVTAILGFLETLRGPAREDVDARTRFMGIMEDEARRMIRLVDDLLALSRVEERERQRPTAPVDLAALVAEVAATLAPTAAQRGMTVVLDLPKGPVEVPGDREELRQVALNLIENALKYGAKGTEVTVTLGPPEDQDLIRAIGVGLSVQDQGEGIAAHHLPRLTERFYRVDGHRSRRVGGTGLGLAIVKHIVNRHRGRLRIVSQPGEGSTFTVILPAGQS